MEDAGIMGLRAQILGTKYTTSITSTTSPLIIICTENAALLYPNTASSVRLIVVSKTGCFQAKILGLPSLNHILLTGAEATTPADALKTLMVLTCAMLGNREIGSFRIG